MENPMSLTEREIQMLLIQLELAEISPTLFASAQEIMREEKYEEIRGAFVTLVERLANKEIQMSVQAFAEALEELKSGCIGHRR